MNEKSSNVEKEKVTVNNNGTHNHHVDEIGLYKVVCDLWSNLEKSIKGLFFLTIVCSIIVVYILIYYGPLLLVDIDCIIDKSFSVYLGAIVLSLTTYSFLLNTNKEDLKKTFCKIQSKESEEKDKNVNKNDNEEKRVFDVFCATTIWFTMNSTLILILSVLCMLFNSDPLLVSFWQCFIFYTIVLFFDLLLHMYSFRTFIATNQDNNNSNNE